MNRIVREHYPVSKLPEDLLEGQADVRVTINVPAAENADHGASTEAGARSGRFTRFEHPRRSNYADINEVVDYVRSLRDEWIDRER